MEGIGVESHILFAFDLGRDWSFVERSLATVDVGDGAQGVMVLERVVRGRGEDADKAEEEKEGGASKISLASQQCDSCVIMVSHLCHDSVTLVSQQCHHSVTFVSQWCHTCVTTV